MSKTLNRSETEVFFKDEDGYQQLVKNWSEITNSEKRSELRSIHHFLYAILRGKDWTKGFTLISNEVKLENGAAWSNGHYKAMQEFRSKSSLKPSDMFYHVNKLPLDIFGDIFSEDVIFRLLEVLPERGTVNHYLLPEPYRKVKVDVA